MAVQTGVNKKLSFIKETTWNTAPANSTSAKYLRRVTSDLDVAKDTYSSNEIRTDFQIADLRHGMVKVEGGIKGELSPGAYFQFIGAGLRGASGTFGFTALPTMAMAAMTMGATGQVQTLTCGTSPITAGFKAGMVMRMSAGSGAGFTTANLFIVGVTSGAFSVIGWPTYIATGVATSCTLTAVGAYSRTPETGHQNLSFTVEHYFTDLTKSESFTGCRVANFALSIPATGIATADIGFMGANYITGAAQVYTSSTVASTGGLLTGVNGVIVCGGSVVASITQMSINYDGGMTTGAVLGSNFTPDVFAGRVKVTGQMTAYFDGVTLRDYFLQETKFAILGVMYADQTTTSDFISFAMYNCKATGASKSDGEQGLTLTIPFQALLNTTPASDTTDQTLRTTLMIQDSLAA